MDRLFVYGTLRPGSKNVFAQKLAQGAKHLGEARIQGRLFRVTHYPALTPSDQADDWVQGDLFEGLTVELWAELDEYEGDQYLRRESAITLEDGRIRSAYVYWYVLPTEHLERIISGDWSLPNS